jgi:hypothetical protein
MKDIYISPKLLPRTQNLNLNMYDVKLSRRLKLINSSRADSRVNSLKSNVSGTVSVPIIRAMILLWDILATVISLP